MNKKDAKKKRRLAIAKEVWCSGCGKWVKIESVEILKPANLVDPSELSFVCKKCKILTEGVRPRIR
jgi:hypothetical protein